MIKSVTKTLQNETKQQRHRWLAMLIATLRARRKVLMQSHPLIFKLKEIIKMKLYLMGFTQELMYLEI